MNLVNWKIHFIAQELRKNNLFFANERSFLEGREMVANTYTLAASLRPRVSETIRGKKGARVVIKVCCSLSSLRLLGLLLIHCFANRNEPGLPAGGEELRGRRGRGSRWL